MAKRMKKSTPARKPTRKERSRAAREARYNRWIVGGAIAVGILLIGVLGYGYIAEVVIKGRQPVATVNGEPIPAASWQARVRELRSRMELELAVYQQQRMAIDPTEPNAEFYLQQLDQEIRSLQTQLSDEYRLQIGQQMLQQMAQEEIFRQEAERLGISVTAGEVDQAIEQFFGFDRTALTSSTTPVTGTTTITPTTSMTEEEFEQQYENYVNTVVKPSGLGVDGFRAMFEASLLGQKVREEVTSGIPTVVEQVKLDYIALASEEEADGVMERLDQGEEWDTIVEELEADEESSAYTNELDWRTGNFIAEQFGETISQAVFEAPVGGYVGPELGEGGRYYVLNVVGRETRELDDFMLSYEKGIAFQEWLTDRMQTVEYSEDWQERLPAN
jgi:hypothetical protein